MIFARFAPLAAIAFPLFFASAALNAPAAEIDRVDARFDIFGFAGLSAGGEWIRTSGSARDASAA